jgi:hypothetical protein
VKSQGIKVTKKAFDAAFEAQDNVVHELYNQKSKKHGFGRITAPPYSFMIDTIRMDRFKIQNNGKTRFLLLVEICSRKAFAYVLPSENVGDMSMYILAAYKTFLQQAGHPVTLVKGDDYFSAKQFIEFNQQKNISVYTVVSKDEHVTTGNPLGILDRCVRTLRGLFEKRIHLRDDAKWTQWLHEVITQYNDTPHTKLRGATPSQVYGDWNAMYRVWEEDIKYNKTLDRQIGSMFKPDQFVRLKLAKGAFEKGATQVWSSEVYQVFTVKGSRVKLKTYPAGELVAREAKLNELLRVSKPRNTVQPAAITKANKQSRQDRRMRKEGLPEPPVEKERAAEAQHIVDMLKVGQLAVLDVEGVSDDNVLTIQKDGKTGYVYAGVVTQVNKSRLYSCLQGPHPAAATLRRKN